MNAETESPSGLREARSGRGKQRQHAATARAARRCRAISASVEIEMPRDRNGTFEPQIVKKHERRFAGFDDKILSMYARGMTYARDPGASGRDVRSGSQPRADQRGNGRGGGGSEGLAKPAAGADLWDRLSGCVVW